ncbi:FHS family L-fucose permease-like MFS transporter [Dysgonomonas sp. PFB1-18]|uniref:MFS transporter n=1 Tax=unclassified Dysgonomonas TaxID=2630389 RepID=UPI002476EAA5|nr:MULTISPECIES: MFS transporter [unclassified Dysgonomonas]MDH6309089.1 FHS family L-fucose permease-like MFS transporter [Dysgonomonas sp. PF1-14]MDH6339031.1 FHS family L-fucose permease-like MFS transporter [Dysgonomonas sp. PF1-16]MDH6380338.1 FHS family L-fucose permease-like MFS transporter [Dysgonomonas sp. PFB1-18]MDH6397859.1 FHS family L-fucose permease-like MFS transporter [Dysgonomonas sp. PF1-23]
MSSTTKKSLPIVPIVTMILLFGMISFVTNLAAPIGVIWKNQPALGGSNFLGMLGNMMNFLAYLFMGIPAGKLLTNIGYKKTALVAIAVGFLGVFIQFLSGIVGVGAELFSLPLNFYVYLLGAFVAGFSVCMLNTVVNPMLNLLGGGGNKGNQLIQTGGTFNSLAGTLTPMFVGALIGQVTAGTAITDVNPVLFIAMGVFAFAFIALLFVKIEDPDADKTQGAVVFEHSPWAFRHFVLGAIGIFVYVGIEIGIPGTLNFFLSDVTDKGAGLDAASAASIGGFVAGTYWFLMLIGRFIGASIGAKVSSKAMLTGASGLGIVLVLAAMFLPKTVMTAMPVFTGSSFAMTQVPLSALLLVLCGFCTSIMWGGIFNLAVEGLGKYTARASGIFMMMVVGGGVLPLIQNKVADMSTYMTSYWVVILGLAFLLYYALIGSKNVNKDIPVK